MDRSALATFVGVYLDEDLFEAYADEFEALAAFMAEQPEHSSKLPGEIDELLASDPSDAELRIVLRDLGMGIDTNAATYREWLAKIADRVRAGQR